MCFGAIANGIAVNLVCEHLFKSLLPVLFHHLDHQHHLQVIWASFIKHICVVLCCHILSKAICI